MSTGYYLTWIFVEVHIKYRKSFYLKKLITARVVRKLDSDRGLPREKHTKARGDVSGKRPVVQGLVNYLCETIRDLVCFLLCFVFIFHWIIILYRFLFMHYQKSIIYSIYIFIWRIHIYVCIYVCAYMYVYMCVHIYMCMYIYMLCVVIITKAPAGLDMV